MSGVLEQLGSAVATAVGLSLLGLAVAAVRARRRRRGAGFDLDVPTDSSTDEFGVWVAHGPVLGRRRHRVRVRPGSVAWFEGDAVQPRWEVAPHHVRLDVRPRSTLHDTTRLVLTGPEGRRRIRVSRGLQRPLGELDRRYEEQVEADAHAFEAVLRAAGGEVSDGRRGRRP